MPSQLLRSKSAAASAFADDADLLAALAELDDYGGAEEQEHKSEGPAPVHVASSKDEKVEPAHKGFKKLKQIVKAAGIIKQGFHAERHSYEQEGSNALLFRDVPGWIEFKRISGCRYRSVTMVLDHDDALAHHQNGVTSFGYPGASGWADKIGDVAIHYMHEKWAVFSRIFPFTEQESQIRGHDSQDVLLLGPSSSVLLTPQCAHTIGDTGLADLSTPVTLLDSEGSVGGGKTVPVSALPSGVRHRLFLTWGHERSAFASQVAHWERPLQALLDETETRAAQVGRFFFGFVTNRRVVGENWLRYPGAPLDPSYYNELLSKSVAMSTEEEAARMLLEPEPSPRGTRSVQVSIDIGGSVTA